MKKISLLILCLAAFTIGGLAQSVPSPQVPWLNNNSDKKDGGAGSLIQKNLFTGIANIHVPLFSYTNSGLDLGVSLNYMTDGIKVDRISSEVGIGWELSNGPTIERQVVGVEDDIQVDKAGTIFYVPYPARIGYWFNNTDTNKLDQGPDIFKINIGGKQILFLFSKTGELLTIPKSKIKVDRYINGSLISGQINTTSYNSYVGNTTFVVTDENGNKLYFNKGYQATETNTWDLTSQGIPLMTQTYYPIDRWFLDKIQTYEGDEIKYTYDQISFDELQHKSQVFREVDNNWAKGEEKWIKKNYAVQRLKKIEYPNNINIEYTYDNISRCDLPSSFRLTEIAIKERSSRNDIALTGLKYKFNQAYFVSPDSNTSIQFSNYQEFPITTNCNQFNSTRYRLKLTSINMETGGLTKKYYSFDYSSINLPERVTGGRDIFGYPNRSASTQFTGPNGTWNLMVPLHNWPDATHYVGMNVAPDFDVKYAKAGMLEKMTTNGGAEYKLIYGCNTNANTNLGGLRLDTIKVYDGYNHDNDINSVYTYEQIEQFLIESQNYYTYYQEGGEPGDQGQSYYLNKAWNNSAIVTNTELDGSNYGYKKVTEAGYDASYNFQGKTVTYFSGLSSDPAINSGQTMNLLIPGNPSNDPDFYKSFGLPPFSNKQYLRSWAIGVPTRAETYDNNNQLQKSVDFNFRASLDFKIDDNYKSSTKLPSKKNNFSGGMEFYRDIYYPATGSILLDSIVLKEYVASNRFIEKRIRYQYDAKENCINSSFTNSSGQLIKTSNYYNYNWNINTPSPGAAINKMNQDGLERLIYSETWKNNIENNGDNSLSLIKLATSAYTIVNSNIIRPKYNYCFAASYPLSSAAFSGVSSLDMNSMTNGVANIPNFKKTSESSLFDSKGNAIETKDVKVNDYNAAIFDIITGSKLAEATNAKYGEIAYCGFESEYTSSGVDYNKGNWGFNPAFIVSQPSFLGRLAYNVSSSSGHTMWTNQSLVTGKKYTISFWVYQGGNIQANDGTNTITMQQVASYNGWTLYQNTFTATASSIGVWGEGYVDEMRVYPSDAAMTNYNYLPLCGITSTVDPNNKFSTTEYDGFGRKTFVRDQDGNILQKIVNVDHGND